MPEILLVEDDRTLALGVEYSLCQEGFTVQTASRLDEARRLFKTRPDLVLLDLGLPDGSGYDLCREIRRQGDTPVIFLTACDEEANVVLGLDMGADDYIAKPFHLRELISRIRAVLRRRLPENGDGLLRCGGLTVDTKSTKVMRGGTEIALTALEYRLLLTLLLNKGSVLTRNQLLESLWDDAGDYVNDNTLTVYIKRLREKVEIDPEHPVIRTVRGLGYQACDG